MKSNPCLMGLQILSSAKRYFIIDQQIARHFVLYSECLYHPLSFYGNQIITLFLTSTILAKHDKGLGFNPIVRS